MDDVMSMKPGRELSDLTAEAMGWRKGRENYGDMPWYPPDAVFGRAGGVFSRPDFSTDPTAMMECWEWLNRQGLDVAITIPSAKSKANYLAKVALEPCARMDPLRRVRYDGDTPAHALARTVVGVAKVLKDLGVTPQ